MKMDLDFRCVKEMPVSMFIDAYPSPLSTRTSCENGRLIARQRG